MTFASSPIYKKRVQAATTWLQNVVHKDYLPKSFQVNGLARGERASYREARPAKRATTFHPAEPARPSQLNLAPDSETRTFVHEITHELEFAHPEINFAAREFLAKRRGDEDLQPLSILSPERRWRSDEISFKDKWKEYGGDPYAGKTYGNNGSELVTMGVERLWRDPILFAKEDPEYFEFIVNLIQKR
jgi:hypothetical protein